MRAEIADKVASFPTCAGVYVFRDGRGKALYVGKAANLRARVRSYLKPGGDGRPLLRFVEREAADVEFLAVGTEQEALLLEDTIVKREKPEYNVKLRDDKAFLMLRLDRREDWPWFRLVRRRQNDRAEYFGPFASAKAVRRTLALLHKVVPLRDCRDGVFHNRSRPCIKFEIGRCPGPCVGLIEPDGYDRLLDEAVEILRGKAGPVLRRMREQMDVAAERLEFERAQALKQQIEALAAVAERQSVVAAAGDVDAVGIHRDGDRAVVVLLMLRGGKLESSRRFDVPSALPDELLLAELLARFYHGDRFVPGELLLPIEIEDSELLADWLSEKRGASVALRVPQRGRGRRQVEMAIENARLSGAAVAEDRAAAAERIAEMLELGEPPERLHCLDVSTIQGRATVASRVCFVDGKPRKDFYRRFEISAENAGDDFSALREAVTRSLKLCLDSTDDLLPDLMVVDGGRGQLKVALEALDSLGLRADLPAVGLAKARLRGLGDARERSEERIFRPGSSLPIPLPDGAPETMLITALRDEAHRFAIGYHRKVRGRLGSELDEIPGVGPARRRALLRHFGSLSGLRQAELDAIRAIPGIPDQVAERVYDSLRGQ